MTDPAWPRMGRRVVCLVLAITCSVAASHAAQAGEPAVASASCRAVYGPDGFSARKIKTKRVGCRAARSVLRRWLNAYGQPVTGPTGWSCSYNVGGQPGRWHCRRAGKLIAFSYYADEA